MVLQVSPRGTKTPLRADDAQNCLLCSISSACHTAKAAAEGCLVRASCCNMSRSQWLGRDRRPKYSNRCGSQSDRPCAAHRLVSPTLLPWACWLLLNDVARNGQPQLAFQSLVLGLVGHSCRLGKVGLQCQGHCILQGAADESGLLTGTALGPLRPAKCSGCNASATTHAGSGVCSFGVQHCRPTSSDACNPPRTCLHRRRG